MHAVHGVNDINYLSMLSAEKVTHRLHRRSGFLDKELRCTDITGNMVEANILERSMGMIRSFLFFVLSILDR